MIFNKTIEFDMKLSKTLIIDFVEKELALNIFNNIEINPYICCSINNERMEMNDLDINEFKSEIFSMVISINNSKCKYSLVMLKESAIHDYFTISLNSYDKIWVDESISEIKNYFCNYDEKKIIKKPIEILEVTKNEIATTFVEDNTIQESIKKENIKYIKPFNF